MKVPVLCAAQGAAWEADLVLALDRGPYGVAIVRRCVDIVDLLAVAASGQARAALVASDLRRLDADAVDRLGAASVVPVGVVRRGDTVAEERFAAMGVQFVVPDDAEASVIAAVITQATTVNTPTRRLNRTFAIPNSADVRVAPTGAPRDAPTQERRGSVIAVWGPTGAPGRTTVALTLADELSRLGPEALLIDADVYGGVVASVLGLLDESPGIAAACRQATTARFDVSALAGLCWQLSPTLRVLTGMTRADRWPELRPAAIDAVLGAARGLADFTVVDCGFNLETDEELSFDTVAPRRNGATLAILDAADVILAVGAADPVGVQRLVRGLIELREAEVSAPVWVVLNKVRRGVVPGDPASELTAALDRFAGRTPAALLPSDPAGLDAALALGQTLAESRPNSPLRTAFIELAAALAGRPVPARRGRR